MKKFIFLPLCLLTAICCFCSCDDDKGVDKGIDQNVDKDAGKDKASYPIVTVIEEGTFTGKLRMVPNPPHTDPPLPGVVLGLATESEEYALAFDGTWIGDEDVTVGNQVYKTDDRVEIEGAVTKIQDSETIVYTELRVRKIRLLE